MADGAHLHLSCSRGERGQSGNPKRTISGEREGNKGVGCGLEFQRGSGHSVKWSQWRVDEN